MGNTRESARPHLGLPWWLSVKNPPAMQETHAGDTDLIPGLGRSSGKEMANHSSILAWKIPWTGEPGGLQSMG